MKAVSIRECFARPARLPDGYPVRLRSGAWANVGDEVIIGPPLVSPSSAYRESVVAMRRGVLGTFTVLELSDGSSVRADDVKLVEPYQPGDWMGSV